LASALPFLESASFAIQILSSTVIVQKLPPVPVPEGTRKPPLSGWWLRFRSGFRAHRGKSVALTVALALALILAFVDALLASPMRTWAERMMNAKLNGYTVHIGKVRPHLWKFAFDLDDLVLAQNTHPVPPVADIGALQFSLIFKELLSFRIAGDLTIDRPALHINLAQIQDEATSQVSLKDRGWQSAVESIFPIKLDRVKIREGSLLYLSSTPTSKPLHLTGIYMVADNVRNSAAIPGTFPSPVSLEGLLFDTGKIFFKGSADFLREPYAAARGELRLFRIPLDRLDPLAPDYNLKTQGGLLSLDGALEYTPEAQTAHFANVRFEDLRVDYFTSTATKAVEKEHGRKAVQLAKSVRNAPKLVLQVDNLTLSHSQIGFVNKSATPSYRLFLTDVNLGLKNLSNQSGQGRSEFQARGAFMGSGTTNLSGNFRAAATPADFQVHLKLDNARLPDLNRFLKASTGVDVAEGLFSVYTELTVKNGRVEGYLKPLIRDLKIYDKQKDQGKSFGKRVELHVLQVLATLFKNHSTKTVATVTRISGSTTDPKTNEWEAIRKLIGNGLSKAILPGFLDKPKDAPSKP
jgi:hypothetical protein